MSFVSKGLVEKRDLEVDPSELLSMMMQSSTLDPSVYQYYKNIVENRTIIFNNQIDSNLVEGIMIPLLQMDNDGSGKPISILFSSNGGSLFDGMPLCDVIDSLKTPTTLTVMTYAYSMGGLILMAGYNNPNVRKRCYKHSTGLLHGGSVYLDGVSSNVKDQYKFVERFEKKVRDYTISHSHITEEEYEKLERYEWYMTAEEMLKYGLVDEIIGEERADG